VQGGDGDGAGDAQNGEGGGGAAGAAARHERVEEDLPITVCVYVDDRGQDVA
jgi:hypothetical protein